MQTLKPFINGQFIDSVSTKYNKIFDPSTGEQIAQVPACTREELESAIQAAKAAYPAWSATPVRKRAQLMLRLRELIVRDMESLTLLCATENGKTLAEAAGDVGKALEMTELAANAPMQLMGDSLMNTSTGYDTTTYREPLGVFAGIAPWNFPAMIPVGWMAPLCIVCGNTFVLKPASRLRSLTLMSVASAVTYLLLLFAGSGAAALGALFLFGFSIAGTYPTAIAKASGAMSNASVGVLLPVAGVGAIVMPYITGAVAQAVGIHGGMMCPLATLAGMLVSSVLMRRAERTAPEAAA